MGAIGVLIIFGIGLFIAINNYNKKKESIKQVDDDYTREVALDELKKNEGNFKSIYKEANKQSRKIGGILLVVLLIFFLLIFLMMNS